MPSLMPEQVTIKKSLDIMRELENPLLHYSTWLFKPRTAFLPPDVAVGAPKEDDFSGAVYIYHGDARGMVPQYSMVIGVRMSWSMFLHSFYRCIQHTTLFLPSLSPPPVKDTNH